MKVHEDEFVFPNGERGVSIWHEPETREEKWVDLRQKAMSSFPSETTRDLLRFIDRNVPWTRTAWNDLVHGPRWRETYGDDWNDDADFRYRLVYPKVPPEKARKLWADVYAEEGTGKSEAYERLVDAMRPYWELSSGED